MGGMAAVLINNVDVYAIANYYDIPPLQKLATSKFDDLLTAYAWDSKEFLSVLQHIHKRIPDKTCALRQRAVKAAASHIQDIVYTYCPDFPAAICDNNDLPGDLLEHVVFRYEEQLDEGRTELRDTVAKLSRTCIELDNTGTELHETKTELGKTKVELEKTAAELRNAQVELEKSRTECAKNCADYTKVKAELEKTKRELEETKNRIPWPQKVPDFGGFGGLQRQSQSVLAQK
ncbi:hypothetical protein W97_05020 [Coniosporium apollinis CBS 100218]|uniref:Uncharacterized protein n=1 Tax=Coniosporium apollinis (strain CBS 100218) TaxID=1168221 RepID=R7YVU0_CONA1|nr:uncharacterized protein W97_05020 [Coniosporium apollinis CBS 100218]EON65781.1 hypothetical protein W97_05020 [Coniosporium apollinis CBS 100218]